MTSTTRKYAAAMAAIGTVLATATAMAAGPAPNTVPTRGLNAAVGTPACKGCFAVVASNGALIRGKGAPSATQLNTGQYAVRFKRPIGACAWTATLGLDVFGSASPPGEVSLTGLIGSNNGIFLETFNSGGVLTDRSFHLLTSC
jgi:hypothetical protein